MQKIELAPIVFEPYLKSVIWGGDKICRYKGIEQTRDNIGESWEISAVPGHESVVAGGSYKGMKLTELIERFGEDLLGSKVVEKYGLHFPLLIKIIDAADNLSVQVHPDDELAKIRHDSLGKTEMWYIIDTDPGAKIFAGLNTPMTPDEYTARVAKGTFAETLAVHESAPGDVFFLPAGRVHAIGAGNLLAEIQESSDITYRIYDYDRRDADGNPRQLHTDLAKDAIDFTVYPEYKSPRPDEHEKDAVIVSCGHFSTRRFLLEGEEDIALTPGSFNIIMCLQGEATLHYPAGELKLSQGSTALIPAALHTLSATGSATLLLSAL